MCVWYYTPWCIPLINGFFSMFQIYFRLVLHLQRFDRWLNEGNTMKQVSYNKSYCVTYCCIHCPKNFICFVLCFNSVVSWYEPRNHSILTWYVTRIISIFYNISIFFSLRSEITNTFYKWFLLLPIILETTRQNIRTKLKENLTVCCINCVSKYSYSLHRISFSYRIYIRKNVRA